MKGLHSLHPASGSTQRKKRLGRGNGSGIGTYSGKGIKGQRSRAGGRSGITARAIKSYLLRIPKTRGFLSGRGSYSVVNIYDLQKHFSDGEHITPKSLRAKGLITGGVAKVKILSSGTLAKKFFVAAHSFSSAAQEMIKKAGGTVEVISRGEKARQKKEAKK